MRQVIILLSVIGFLVSGCKVTAPPVVDDFELDSYLGKWYEIARYPHSFEKDLQAVSAEYQLKENGKVKVINRGYNAEKEKWSEAIGEAKLRERPDKGHLKVTFIPPVYIGGDYRIIVLDEDYQYAMITSRKMNYFWILNREPTMDAELLAELLEQAKSFGFDMEKISLVDQEKNTE
jgi:apolipoprotein D and lipocalin family protein